MQLKYNDHEWSAGIEWGPNKDRELAAAYSECRHNMMMINELLSLNGVKNTIIVNSLLIVNGVKYTMVMN